MRYEVIGKTTDTGRPMLVLGEPPLKPVPALVKTLAASAASALPQARYQRMILLLGHMRSGSTALSSVLCHHPEVSGYGETHVTHGRSWSGGAVILNQWRRKAWRPNARFLFDKVLHGTYDAGAANAFAQARVIILARPPEQAISSIINLARKMDLTDWRNSQSAGDYYEQRMEQLMVLWPQLNPHHRVALTHSALTGRPDVVLPTIGHHLGLSTPLINTYGAMASGHTRGGGDPLMASGQTSIVKGVTSLTAEDDSLALPTSRREALAHLFAEFESLADGSVTLARAE